MKNKHIKLIVMVGNWNTFSLVIDRISTQKSEGYGRFEQHD